MASLGGAVVQTLIAIVIAGMLLMHAATAVRTARSIGTTLAVGSLGFREATPIVSVDAGIQLDIGVAPAGGSILATFPVTLDAGESYVVFGKMNGFAASLNLSMLDGTNGFRLDGIDPEDWSGYSVSGAGDVNGDGFGDLISGAAGTAFIGCGGAGESYVVFGKAGGFPASLP